MIQIAASPTSRSLEKLNENQKVRLSCHVHMLCGVDDGHTGDITSTFYETEVEDFGRLDNACAAFALHKTVWSVNIPFDQPILQCIHISVPPSFVSSSLACY